MEAKELVVNKELSMKIYYLMDKKPDSLFYWANNVLIQKKGDKYIDVEGFLETYEALAWKDILLYPAYTAGELLEILPNIITKDDKRYFLTITFSPNAGHASYSFCENGIWNHIKGFKNNKIENAIAELLIYLLSNNLMEIK